MPPVREEIRFMGPEAVARYENGFSKWLSVQSVPVNEEIAKAACLVEEEKYDEAETKVAKIILSASLSAEKPLVLLSQANLIRGDAAFHRGLFAEAEKYYSSCQELATLANDDFLVTASAAGIGVARGSQGKNAEALKILDQLLRSHPDNARMWNNKATALGNLGRYEEALVAYDQAVRLDPNISEAWIGKGTTLVMLGKSEDALAAYEKAIQLNPNFASAWFLKGVALCRLRKYQQALSAFDEALRLNPNDAET
jgi:tetratricopeptide (TPR) repeat protein